MRNLKNQNGIVLIFSILIIVLISSFMMTMLIVLDSKNNSSISIQDSNRAFYLSESGARYILSEIGENKSDIINKGKKTFLISEKEGFSISVERRGKNLYIQSTGFCNSSNVTNLYVAEYSNAKIRASETARQRANENSAIHSGKDIEGIRLRDIWIEQN